MSQVSNPRRGDYQQAIERLFNEGTVSGLSEVQLLERFAARRDEAAFEALVNRHGPMVLGVCRRFLRDPNDVDDAFQAVFLVLVRRAGDIRRKELLGNWLYGVACRVSIRARSLSARRPATITEADGDQLAGESPEPDEGRSWLHEEVERLPRRYRQPVVACYFEGRTHEEAATLLGCPLGTVKGRLSRARDLLRKRLERRGLAVSAVALTAQLASPDLRAAVPAPLAHATVRTGLALATAGASLMTTSAISTSVLNLTEGVIHAMVVTHVKAIAIPTILVAAGVLTAGATVAARQAADGEPETKQTVVVQAAPKPEEPKAQTGEAVPDSDLEFLYRLENWADDLSALEGRLLADLRMVTNEKGKEKVQALHRARVEAMIRRIEKEKPASQAGRDLKMAFLDFMQQEVSQLTSADYRRMGFQPFGGFGAISSTYKASLAKLNADLRALETPEEQALARDLHRARLASLTGSGGMRPLQEITAAYLAFREKVDADPRHPRSTSMEGRSKLAAREQFNTYQEELQQEVAKAQPSKPEPEKPAAAANPPKADPAQAPQVAQGGGSFDGGFGGGYDGPTDEEIEKVRQEVAGLSATLAKYDESPRNKGVLEALDQPITLRMDDKSTLDDMLKQIKSAAKTADGKKIPIYVDPKGIEEADASLSSPVVIDLEDVPLRFSLRLALKQLGLAYCVRDGVLIISSLYGVHQELKEAESELMGLHPDKVIVGPGGQRSFMGAQSFGAGMR